MGREFESLERHHTERENMWTLVFVALIGSNVEAATIGTYTTMYECFEERENLSNTIGKGQGYFKPSTQAVCIYVEGSDV